MGLKKIVLLTTGQPSSNPRIVKEANILLAAGYEVMVLYCFLINWAEEKDKSLLQNAAWKSIMVGGSPFKHRTQFLYTRLRSKACRLFNQVGLQLFFFSERTQARCYDELLKEAKKIKADWYIAHNLGALPVAAKAAGYHKTKAGFDFEDYHRGELLPGDAVGLKRIAYIEKKYLASLNYISASSPMILGAVKIDFPGLPIPLIILNNSCSLKQQPLYYNREADYISLKLFWFSQTIGLKRGLETLIEAMIELDDASISLTLAGRCDEDMLAYINQVGDRVRNSIHFAGIIQPEELPALASKFDVGMTLELNEPCNRDICLTNKIFTYLLAGNAVILSETAMQMEFNATYKVGQSFAINHITALAEKIKFYKDVEKLNEQRRHNYELARQQLNWEKESEKLLAIIN